MDIVLDARTLDDHFPGIGRYTFHLAQALARHSQLHLTLIVNPWGRDSRFPSPNTAFPTARIVPLPHTPFAPQAQWRIPRLLREFPADLYHSPYYIYPYAVTLPRVLTVHDTIPTRFPHYFSPAKRLLIRTLKALAIRRASHIIADSWATAEDVKRFYGVEDERITVAPLAPAPHFRPQSAEAIGRVRERYGLPEDYFLYVGSAKPHKNVGLLLRVWERLSRGYREIPTLLLVGLQSEREKWQGANPFLRGLGFVPESDLPALYAGARAFLFPSLYEGFGLPVLEAMACGTPVVCSAIPALREIVGDAGWLLSPREVEAWEEAVVTLWQDERARATWGERALARARAFSWERTAEIVVGVYRRIKEERGRSNAAPPR